MYSLVPEQYSKGSVLEQIRLLRLGRHLSILAQPQQVSLQHCDRHLSDGWHVDGGLGKGQCKSSGLQRRWTHLLPDIRLEVLVASDIDTDTPILEPLGLDLVILVRHSTDHDV
jgi:hypothetical protein